MGVCLKRGNGRHDLIGEFLKVVPAFGIALKAHGFAIDDQDGAEGVPPAISWHGLATADDVDGDDGDVGPCGDQADSWLGFR